MLHSTRITHAILGEGINYLNCFILKVLHGRSGGLVGGQVSDYNATGGPNSSAEAELVSLG